MKKLFALSLLVAGSLLVACEEKKDAPKAAETGKSAVDSMKDSAGKAVDAGAKAVMDAKDSTVKAAEEAKDAVVKTAEEVKDSASKAADEVKKDVVDAGKAAEEGVMSDLKKQIDAFQPQIDGIRKQVDALPELVKKPAQDALASAEKTYGDIKTSFDSLGKAPVDQFTKLSGDLGNQIKSLSDQLKKIIPTK
jgi:hypothetical protein